MSAGQPWFESLSCSWVCEPGFMYLDNLILDYLIFWSSFDVPGFGPHCCVSALCSISILWSSFCHLVFRYLFPCLPCVPRLVDLVFMFVYLFSPVLCSLLSPRSVVSPRWVTPSPSVNFKCLSLCLGVRSSFTLIVSVLCSVLLPLSRQSDNVSCVPPPQACSLVILHVYILSAFLCSPLCLPLL